MRPGRRRRRRVPLAGRRGMWPGPWGRGVPPVPRKPPRRGAGVTGQEQSVAQTDGPPVAEQVTEVPPGLPHCAACHGWHPQQSPRSTRAGFFVFYPSQYRIRVTGRPAPPDFSEKTGDPRRLAVTSIEGSGLFIDPDICKMACRATIVVDKRCQAPPSHSMQATHSIRLLDVRQNDVPILSLRCSPRRTSLPLRW
jgi:hypothetical protein